MRKLLSLVVAALLAAAAASAQSTSITASHIVQDLSGTPLYAGQLCLTPVNQSGAPTGFQANSTQYNAQQACFAITSGAVSGVSVPDTAATNPPIGYQAVIEDIQGNVIRTFSQPIYPTGTTWSLDAWTPTQSVIVNQPTTVQASTAAPQGRCGTSPALFYSGTPGTGITIYSCSQQIWVPVTGTNGGLTSAAIATALNYTPVSPAQLTSAINSVATGYATQAALTAAVTGLASQAYVGAQVAALNLSSYASQAWVNSALNGYVTLSGLSSTLSSYATQTYVTNAINAAISGTSGGGGGTGGSTFDSGIGSIVRTGSMSDGTVAFKTCYITGSLCNGGVGYNPPASPPTRQAGQSTPNASTGTANAVAIYTLKTIYPKVGNCFTKSNPYNGTNTPAASTQCYTEALWTTTGGGLGADTTSTNWARDFWVKSSMPAGTANIEFDTYDFDGSWDYMGGTECEYGKYVIQYDNQGNGWVDTAVPCGVLYDGNWHHIQQTFHRDLASAHNCASGTAPCLWWDDIWIDGTLYVINKSLPATATTWSGSGGQIQFDLAPTSASSGSPATGTLWVDTDTVTMGLAESGDSGNPGGGGNTTSGTGELDSFNFDSGTPSSVGLTAVGSPVISTSNFHSSPNSAAFPAGNNYYQDTLSSSCSTLYSRKYIYVSSVGTNSNAFLRLYHGGAELISWYFNTVGIVTAYDQAAAADIGTGYTMPTGAIHRVETYTKISPTAGQVILEVDGTVVYTSAPTLNTGTAAVDTVWFGQIGNTAPAGWGTTYMDNVDFSCVGWIGPI